MSKWCEKCQVEYDIKFCMECGSELSDRHHPSFCECGSKIFYGAKFCSGCGKSVVDGGPVDKNLIVDTYTCQSCHNVHEDELWIFCSSCGEKRTESLSETEISHSNVPESYHKTILQGSFWREPITKMEFVMVESGWFTMGCFQGNSSPHECPQHEVMLDSFWIGKYPVTQEQWSKIMINNPSCFKGINNPVDSVSWYDVQDFIQKLNNKSTESGFRLPSEAEWEYAARFGGETLKYSGSNEIESVGWFIKNSDHKTHPVGLKKSNKLGLHDMTGNVREWVQDWYGYNYYSISTKNNPQGPTTGKSKVDRGGGWLSLESACCTTARFDLSPGSRASYLGFRLALSAPKNPNN